MTAVAGLVLFEGGGAAGRQLAPLLRAMLARLFDREPEAERVVTSRSAAFGRGRLWPNRVRAAEESALARAPRTGDGAAGPDVWVVADARLDDVAPDAARAWCEESPEEATIRAAYERWGDDCASHLRGDFAFALHDPRQRKLLVARDVLGARSLYLHRAGGVVRFASEAWALFADPTLRPAPRLEALARYLAGEYTDNGPHLFDGVDSLEPGRTLVVTPSGVRSSVNGVAEPGWPPRVLGDEERARRLADALARAVSLRQARARRVGVSLSGGLDSSSVACLAERERRARHPDRPSVVALHWTFGRLACDETRFSRDVASRWGLESAEVDAVEEARWTAPLRATEPGRPPYFPGIYAHDALLDAATRHGVDVVMTGEAGDLCLGATGLEHAEALARGELGRVLRRTVPSLGKLDDWRRGYDRTLRQLIPWRLRKLTRPLRPLAPDPVLTPRWQTFVEDERLEREVAWEVRPFHDRPTRVAAMGVHGSGHQATAAFLAYFARRRGLELEHPFLDTTVIQLLLSLPFEQRHVAGLRKPKPVLRRAMRDVLPASVHRRAEAAEYSSFVGASLFGRHAEETAALVAPRRLVDLGLVRPEASYDRKTAGTAPPLYRTMDLVALELWLRSLSRSP